MKGLKLVIVHKLRLRWPISGLEEEFLFTHATYAHGAYHRLIAPMRQVDKPAFEVVEVHVHEDVVNLRATLQKI